MPNHKISKLHIFLCVFCGCILLPAQSAPIVQQGKFRLHKFEQPLGEETYQITRAGDSLDAKIDFKFTDRGTVVPLTATFAGSADFSPRRFDIKGKTSRESSIDEAVEAQPQMIRVHARERWTEMPRPDRFFTIAGYAPVTMQMLLVDYWKSHGSPAELSTFPSGQVRIEARGEDPIPVGGQTEELTRYSVAGLIWGRETLWFNHRDELVAAVTIDAEFDHFEAVRDGYEGALGLFVGRAGEDGMAALAEVSKQVDSDAGASGSSAKTLAIVGGTLVDGTGNPALADAVVLIRDGRIAAVGARSQVEVPKEAEVIDGRGKTILPGLWDMHAHFEQVEWGPIYLAAGVTTVRDCGNEFEFITAARDAIAAGRGLGPRILAAGIVDGSGPLAIGVARVDTPEQARYWVHRYHDAGFQQMKIYSSVKLDEVKAVAEEAHRLGMTVTGHVPGGLNAYQVIAAGQDQINHIGYIEDLIRAPIPRGAGSEERMRIRAAVDLNSPAARKAIAYLKAHHTLVDPTLALYEWSTATAKKPVSSFEPGVNKVAPEMVEQLTQITDPPASDPDLPDKVLHKEVELVGALHRAGIPIVAGTDQTVPGYSLYREIELYTQAGFTPMEAIQAATLVPARAMKLDAVLGTIEPGKRADMILLHANPLDDIHNIRTVETVISGGRIFHSAGLWRSVGFQP